MVVKVIVNGIGVIGKRVAHAVKLQDDMKLIGISDVSPSPALRTFLEPQGPLYKTDLYCSVPELTKNFTDAGMYVHGNLPDLLKSRSVDVVVDATPAGIGAKNKQMYEKYGVKVVFQGGEEADVADMTFNSLVNYKEAFGKNSVRVPSCNTTSLIRTLWTVDKNVGVDSVFVSLIRRATDPCDPSKGPINAIVPDSVPSHHGPDVKTVLKNMDIITMAAKIPTTLAHVHMVYVKLKRKSSSDEIRKLFSETPRIILLKKSHGYTSTAEIIERFRDLGRLRYDMPEVVVWEEMISVKDDRLFWAHAVHSESIVVPESIDAIRAMTGLEKDGWKSIEKTDKSLGIR